LLTIHGLTKNEVSFQRGMNYLIERFVGIPIENHILSRLANIIVVTPYDKKFIPNTKANIHTISNGIQNEYFNIKDNKKPNNLLFVGGIAPRKGILDLLKAMKIIIKKNNQVKLNIVGGIVSKEYFEIIHRYVKDNGLQEHVNYTGYLNDQDLREKYSECEIFVFPSHEESQGIVLLEAMACGKAIVASNIGGIPYVIKNEKTGLLFECGNIEELADKIITLLTNKELNEYIKINCVKDAIKYKWPKIAEQTIKVYKELYEDNQKY
jgi:glycosyltransferase involved in cell wall biosynthesis